MDYNIPNWTRECIGERLTIDQFLNDPEAQVLTAACKIQQSYEKYGNIEDAFAIYFSGRPVKGNVSKDVTGTSVPQYVNKTLRHLGI
jgi:hypothetical protein